MKTISRNSFVLLVAIALFGSSCMEDKCTSTRTYTDYTPVYKTMKEIRDLVEPQAPKPLSIPGKIYVYGNLLLLNDYGKGIHVYDNSDKRNPTSIAFLQIPGNVDMSVRNGVLYADNFIDLVAFDLMDFNNIRLAGREENVFPDNYTVHKEAGRYLADPSQGIAVDWIEEVREVPCDEYYIHDGFRESNFDALDMANNSGNSVGQGGSMARFTIMGHYLYAIDEKDMRLFDLSTPFEPSFSKTVSVGWGIETIFPYYRNGKEYLFIGANNGMYIFSNENLGSPNELSFYGHVNSCDPVVVEGNLAFVTLRSGNNCQGFTDQLDIVDVSDLKKPGLIKSFNMFNPHGLGIDNGLLFICDGLEGLKVYNIKEDIVNISELKNIEDRLVFNLQGNAYDVIPINGNLILSTPEAFFQIDYSNPNDLQILSSIKKSPAL